MYLNSNRERAGVGLVDLQAAGDEHGMFTIRGNGVAVTDDVLAAVTEPAIEAAAEALADSEDFDRAQRLAVQATAARQVAKDRRGRVADLQSQRAAVLRLGSGDAARKLLDLDQEIAEATASADRAAATAEALDAEAKAARESASAGLYGVMDAARGRVAAEWEKERQTAADAIAVALAPLVARYARANALVAATSSPPRLDITAGWIAEAVRRAAAATEGTAARPTALATA